MPTIAVGDIHGRLPALIDLLDQLRDQVRNGDTIVFLGDYIDRGPNTRECIDVILKFRCDVKAKVVCLCGNHEDWLLRTLHDHGRHSWLLGMEAFATIRSYSAGAADALHAAASAAGPQLYLGSCKLPYEVFFDTVPNAHLQFFESLLLYHQDSNGIFAHGGLDPEVPLLQDQRRDSLIWGGDGFPKQYRGQELVVYGHKNNAHVDSRGWPHPRIIGQTIGLDTIAHGVLTAMQLPDRQVFQSAQYAETYLDV